MRGLAGAHPATRCATSPAATTRKPSGSSSCSRRGTRSASPAKQGQLDLMYAYYKNREADSADRPGRPVHPREPDPSARRLRLLHPGPGALRGGRELPRARSSRPTSPSGRRRRLASRCSRSRRWCRATRRARTRRMPGSASCTCATASPTTSSPSPRYYMKRGAYVGALNRARNLIESYDGAPAVLEALEDRGRRPIAGSAWTTSPRSPRASMRRTPMRRTSSSPVAGTVGRARDGDVPANRRRGGRRRPAAVRAGRWEARVGAGLANSADVDFKGGTTAEIDSGVGFLLGVGYHFNDRLQFGCDLQLRPEGLRGRGRGRGSGRLLHEQGQPRLDVAHVRRRLQLPDRTVHPVRRRWRRLVLGGHQHRHRAAGDRLLVASLVRLRLHQLARTRRR